MNEEPIKKNNKVVWIILAIVAVLILASIGGYYCYKHYINKNTSNNNPTSSGQSSNSTSSDTSSTASSKTAGWKIYTCQELGISFKYPSTWGEPKIQAENYTSEQGINFRGKYYSIFFDTDNNYPARVTGYSADYSAYETGYIGDKSNLDLAEITTPTKGENEYSIFVIRKKVNVAGVPTYYDIDFTYMPEASGVDISTASYLNGKEDYKGIVISRGYSTINDRLNTNYEGNVTEVINEEGRQTILDLYNQNISDQTALAQYQEYLLWLTTFQFIN